MSRGWKYRCYADEPETPVADFVCAFLGGATGFYGLIGWVLVSLEIASQLWVGILSIATGCLFSGWLTYEYIKRKDNYEQT